MRRQRVQSMIEMLPMCVGRNDKRSLVQSCKPFLLRVEKLIVEGAGGWKITEGANATEGGRYSDLMVREG
jgi:hypothetical protein